jgi:hypothetical protein
MSLNYDKLSALINDKYLPVLANNIFREDNYFTARLIQKAKEYKERKIVIPLEYGKQTTTEFVERFEVLSLQEADPFTAAEYTPKMFVGTLTIAHEDTLVSTSPSAVKNLVTSLMKNLKKSMEDKFDENLWTRSTNDALNDSSAWNYLDFLVNEGSNNVAVGGIPASGTTPTWWKSQVIDSGDFSTGTLTTEADLLDPTKDTYIRKILQKMVAKSNKYRGEKLFVVPQYIWDMLEIILEPQKTGSKLNERAGKMGFTALDFRGIPIISNYQMVNQQTGDDDGRMYLLNLDHLYMFFNPGARFKGGKFIEPANQNSKTMKVLTYGNLVTSNRESQVVLNGIRSPQAYV